MKVRIVQMDSKVGDFSGNLARMRKALEASAPDELVIFPECCVCGYPAQDLLDYSSFAERAKEASMELIRDFPKHSFVFGSVERSLSTGRPCRNAAYFVREGELVATYFKRLLPTYDVFDEDRFFEAGREPCVVEFQGEKIGLSICEDIWNHDVGASLHNRYSQDPLGDLREKASIFVNLSASPFESAKVQKKREMLKSIAVKYSKPLIYANAVGANDSLIFDGRSYFLSAKGEIAQQAKAFEEDEIVFDTKDDKPSLELKSPSESSDIYDALVLGIRDYCRKTGMNRAFVGLSGGIDSAVTASLTMDALGASNLTLVMMPSRYTSQASNEDALYFAKKTQAPLHIIVIEEMFEAAKKSLQMAFQGMKEDLTEQNLQSRVRGLLIMALSNKFGGLVMSTGNKSELAVGYCTLYGDMNGALCPLSDVYKTQVYDLGREANRRQERIAERVFTRAPSAELQFDQTDQDDLPPYETLDRILKSLVEGFRSEADLVADGFEPDQVRQVLELVRKSEFKRYQMPMGLKVSSKAFGLGRRFPLVHSFD
ncbi:MAG: NAD+ synthase [Bradymonadales bacterium]|nr:MAG: NAD+ synthase [Bradymonadales bacterium]